jgi:cytochrome c oxidase assembly factor CtaG
MANFVTVLSLALLAMFYIAGARKLRAGASCLHITAFAGGWVMLAVALAPPLHELAESRLWAHMVQHELLVLIAAPLLALGRLHLALLALFSRPSQRVAGRWIRRLRVSMPIAWALHAIALWIWHLPALYEAAVDQPLLHAAQHASFLGTALLFWWSVLDRRSGYGAAALYTFATSLHTGILGALIFLTPQPWYLTYGTGPAALKDQQLAGLIMWIPGGAALAFTALCLLWHWLQDMERRVMERERLGLLSYRSTRSQITPMRLAIISTRDAEPRR